MPRPHGHSPEVTVVADLTQADDDPTDTYDCFVNQFTMHLIYDLESALYHSIRLLKPGGTLLVNFPASSTCSLGGWTWGPGHRFSSSGSSRRSTSRTCCAARGLGKTTSSSSSSATFSRGSRISSTCPPTSSRERARRRRPGPSAADLCTRDKATMLGCAAADAARAVASRRRAGSVEPRGRSLCGLRRCSLGGGGHRWLG